MYKMFADWDGMSEQNDDKGNSEVSYFPLISHEKK